MMRTRPILGTVVAQEASAPCLTVFSGATMMQHTFSRRYPERCHVQVGRSRQCTVSFEET